MKVIGTKMTITKKKLHKIMRWFSSASLMHRQLKVDAPYSTSRNTGRTHAHWCKWCMMVPAWIWKAHTHTHIYIYTVYASTSVYILSILYYIYMRVRVYHISVFVNVPKYSILSILQTQIRASNHHPLFTAWLTLADNTLWCGFGNHPACYLFF